LSSITRIKHILTGAALTGTLATAALGVGAGAAQAKPKSCQQQLAIVEAQIALHQSYYNEDMYYFEQAVQAGDDGGAWLNDADYQANVIKTLFYSTRC
jgi:hypothetical protein